MTTSSDVTTLSISGLRRLIAEAGLTHDDCLERSDLQERALTAQALLATTGRCATPSAASGSMPSQRDDVLPPTAHARCSSIDDVDDAIDDSHSAIPAASRRSKEEHTLLGGASSGHSGMDGPDAADEEQGYDYRQPRKATTRAAAVLLSDSLPRGGVCALLAACVALPIFFVIGTALTHREATSALSARARGFLLQISPPPPPSPHPPPPPPPPPPTLEQRVRQPNKPNCFFGLHTTLATATSTYSQGTAT